MMSRRHVCHTGGSHSRASSCCRWQQPLARQQLLVLLCGAAVGRACGLAAAFSQPARVPHGAGFSSGLAAAKRPPPGRSWTLPRASAAGAWVSLRTRSARRLALHATADGAGEEAGGAAASLGRLTADSQATTSALREEERGSVHFVNLSNGVEALPLLQGLPFSFVRIQSSHCEANNFNGILGGLDSTLLMYLALGHDCYIYDFGSRNKKRKAPRAVWYGITFIKYALHRSVHVRDQPRCACVPGATPRALPPFHLRLQLRAGCRVRAQHHPPPAALCWAYVASGAVCSGGPVAGQRMSSCELLTTRVPSRAKTWQNVGIAGRGAQADFEGPQHGRCIRPSNHVPRSGRQKEDPLLQGAPATHPPQHRQLKHVRTDTHAHAPVHVHTRRPM